MIFRVRRIGFDASRRRLDAIELELEVNLPRMHSRPEDEERPELEALVDDLPLLVATFDRDGRLQYLNRTGRRLLQREDAGAEEEWILSDFYADEECERLVKRSLPHAARFGSFQGEAELVSAKGGKIAVMQDVIVHPGKDGTFASFAIVARPLEPAPTVPRPDTTTTWLGFLHDLNNLLSPIIAYSSLVDLHVPDGSPAKRYVHQIQRAADRMRDLSNRAAQGLRTASAETKEVALWAIVEEVARWLGDEHPRHRIEIETPLSQRTIPGDPIALQEVVMNLLRNAVESLPEAGGKISIEIDEPESEVLRLSIRDNGCGIPAPALKRIFEPFYSTKSNGSGLGLAVTREIVSRHNGTIEIETTPGAGTTVRVHFLL